MDDERRVATFFRRSGEFVKAVHDMEFSMGIELSSLPLRKLLLRMSHYQTARKNRAKFEAAIVGAKLKD